MTCKRAHRLLAAYRRDDWSPRDRAALGRHLSTCAACRKIEFSYRRVGESVRQLPSITPPADFRERVFASIRADQERMGRTVAALTEADTSPELTAVSPASAKRPVSIVAARQRRAAWLNPRIAAAGVAAALVLGLLATQILSHGNLGSLAAGLGFAQNTTSHTSGPIVASYRPDAHATAITHALATKGWLVYSASDSSGATTIYSENRQTKTSTPLAQGAKSAPVALRAISNSWALWSTGSGSSWTLYVGNIAGNAGNARTATALLKSGAAATLNGVWANASAALVAITTKSGESQILQFALPKTSAAPTVLAQTTGHTFADPVEDGTEVYWTESWSDASGQHNLLWSRDAANKTQQLSLTPSAFAPHVVHGMLVWVDGQQGMLEARSLSNGQRWVLAQSAESDSVQVAGVTVLWRAGGALHTWDARTHASSAVDPQVRTAAWAEATDSSILWAGPSGAIEVYDI